MRIAGLLMIGVLGAGGLLVGCGSDAPAEIAMTPLAGTINGAPWTFMTGDTSDFLSDEETFFASLYAEDVEACGFGGGSGPHMLGSIPRTAGEYELSLSLNVTFSYDDNGTSENKVATDGVIVVDEVTATTVRGGMIARFDDDNEVDGLFELTICTD